MDKNILQFEHMLKNIIYLEYEKYLTKSKKELLKRDICLINPNKYDPDDSDFQCLIIRNLFKFIINANCKKIVLINGNKHFIEYGEYLTNGLIEYYTFLICKKYDIKYYKDPKYKSNLNFVIHLSEYINLNKYAFRENADKILTSVEFDVFKNRYDIFIKKDYLRKLTAKVSFNSIDKITETFIVYINGQRTNIDILHRIELDLF